MGKYMSWLVNDLERLERDRKSIENMKLQLQTLEAEFNAIKVTNFNKMPSGSGNIQEEKLLTNIGKREDVEANLKATTLFVQYMDTVLNQLTTLEQTIIQRMFIKRERYAADRLAGELGYEVAHVYRLKDKALTHLAQLRYGKGYQT